MNGYNFSEHVRKALAMAREEAAELNHNYVGTEHLLLGLIRENTNTAVTVLRNLNVDLDAVRARVLAIVSTKATALGKTGPDLPYTSRAKKSLELAMSEARDLNHSYVGCEHLLLGLLREGRGVAAQALLHAHATLDVVRTETIRLLAMAEPAPAQRPVRREAAPVTITIEIRHEDGSVQRGEFRDAMSAVKFLALSQFS